MRAAGSLAGLGALALGVACGSGSSGGVHEIIDVQRALGRAAIDAGADLVIGTHPHVIQGIETYRGRRIVYSLGNFVFGANVNPTDKEAII